MRRLGVLGLGAALLLGWGTVALAEPDGGDDTRRPAVQDTGSQDTGSNVWRSHLLFGKKAPPPRPKPAKDKPPKTETPVKPAAVGTDPAGVRAREEAAYLRRMDVCLKLKEIAERTNDAELGRLADQLDERARDVYFRRISALPASHAEPDLDEQMLGQHDELTGAGTPLAPAASTHSVPAPDGRHAAAREEEP
jgi:hypothetical protein